MHTLSAEKRRLASGRPDRRGFVLVLVLVMVTLAAITLVGAARQSLAMARRASLAQEELQRRWGAISCRRVLLGQADDLLDWISPPTSSSSSGWPLSAQASVDFALGGLRFHVVIADEDAKVNLNALYRGGQNSLGRVSSAVLPAASSGGFVMNLRLPVAKDRADGPPPFQSWGQVFEIDESAERADVVRRLQNATREITCWGAGRLNLRRASDESLRLVLDGQVGPDAVGRLIALRRDPAVLRLDSLIDRLQVRDADRAALRRLLTDRSRCHSAWILVGEERRARGMLVVARQGQQRDGETFVW